MDKSLEQAIEELRGGNQQGFQIIYDQTHNYVFSQARMLLRNEADAKDLVQEVYINAYHSIHSLQDNQKIFSWLGGIAFRQATKILRKQKDVLLQSEEDDLFETIVELDPDVQPEQAMDREYMENVVMELIEKLPPLQQGALTAFYYDEMSIRQIAQAYGCSENTIKSRLNYAKKSLKEYVLEKEKKENVKLHSVSPAIVIAAIYQLFSKDRMSAEAAQAVYSIIAQELSLTGAAAAMAGTAGMTMGTGTGGVSGVATGVSEVSGVSGAVTGVSGISGVSGTVTAAGVSGIAKTVGMTGTAVGKAAAVKTAITVISAAIAIVSVGSSIYMADKLHRLEQQHKEETAQQIEQIQNVEQQLEKMQKELSSATDEKKDLQEQLTEKDELLQKEQEKVIKLEEKKAEEEKEKQQALAQEKTKKQEEQNEQKKENLQENGNVKKEDSQKSEDSKSNTTSQTSKTPKETTEESSRKKDTSQDENPFTLDSPEIEVN